MTWKIVVLGYHFIRKWVEFFLRIFFVRVSGDCKDEISHRMLCTFLCSQLECQGKSQKDHRNWSHAPLKGGSPPLQEWIPRGNWSKIPEEEGWCCSCIQCGKPVMSDTKKCTCNKYDFCWQQSWCVDVMSCVYSGTPAYDHPLLWPFFSSLNCKSGLILPFEKPIMWPNIYDPTVTVLMGFHWNLWLVEMKVPHFAQCLMLVIFILITAT